MHIEIGRRKMNSALLMPTKKRDIWYKEPWLILVVGGPLIVVCASVFTAFLAFHGADQVVAKDYYRQGLMINTNLQRDARARELQLTATLKLDLSQKKIRMHLTANQNLPDLVQISLASSGAQSGSVDEIIRRLALKQLTPGEFDLLAITNGDNILNEAALRLLHVKLETNDWRLTGDWHHALESNLQLLPAR
jgi:hypothetical protein